MQSICARHQDHKRNWWRFIWPHFRSPWRSEIRCDRYRKVTAIATYFPFFLLTISNHRASSPSRFFGSKLQLYAIRWCRSRITGCYLFKHRRRITKQDTDTFKIQPNAIVAFHWYYASATAAERETEKEVTISHVCGMVTRNRMTLAFMVIAISFFFFFFFRSLYRYFFLCSPRDPMW